MGIVMEKASFGSLADLMEIRVRPASQAARLCLGVVDGLEYLHRRPITHRDLKPENIMLVGPSRDAMLCKIADLGTARILQTVISNSAMVGTPKYAAPELMQPNSRYGAPVDIFSLAIVIFEIFSAKRAEKELGTNVMQIMCRAREAAITPGRFPLRLVCSSDGRLGCGSTQKTNFARIS